MKTRNIIRLIVWIPLVSLVLITALLFAVEGLGFDPFFWSSTNIMDSQTQITPSQAELATWPTFTEKETGISFQYPPVFKDEVGTLLSIEEQPTCKEILSDNYSYGRRAYVFYSPPPNYPDLSPTSPTVGWMSATLPGEGDRMALSVDCRPFEKKNITSIALYWLNPEKVMLGGRVGYRQLYRYDPDCLYEHYILPTSSGKIVRLSFNACKDSREVLRPYKQAILSTVKFTK
jgi:hypothetical protein